MAKEEQQKLLEQQLVFHDASEEVDWDAPASPTEVASEDMDRENEEPTLLPPATNSDPGEGEGGISSGPRKGGTREGG